MRNRNILLLGTTMIGCFGVHMGIAVAQTETTTQPQSSEQDEFAYIVVTANKREQSVNNVGLTITAASGDSLVDRGVTGPADLGKLVPGFTFTQSLYSTPVFTLRGIGLYDATFGASPSVSIYTDQIPRNVPVMSDALDLDIERLEVLKGPQGTLFGQSSTGGAINYIVGKPTEDFQAGMNASYERFNRAEISGFVSGAITEGLNARLALKGVSGGAWQRSLSRPNDDNGDQRKVAGRLTLDIRPSSDVKIELTATGARDRSDPLAPQYAGVIFNTYGSAAQLATSGNPFGIVDPSRYADLTTPGSAGYDPTYLSRQAVLVNRLNGTDPKKAAAAAAILGTRISNNVRDAEWTNGLLGRSDNEYYQFAGRIDVDLTDTLTLTSSTSYARKNLQYAQDLDATVAKTADVPLVGNVRAFNQEVRIAGDTDTLHWIIGASYDRLKTVQNNLFDLQDWSANLDIITQTYQQFATDLKTYGLFGNVEYEVVPNLTLQGGIRYTNNKLAATICYTDPLLDNTPGVSFVLGQLLSNPPVVLAPGECFPLLDSGRSQIDPITLHLNEDNVSFRVGANYKFDQGTLIYATMSQGYKGGIFSSIGASRVSQYVPAQQEKVIAYEAGVKAPLADRQIQLNAAAFYYDYSNKQVRARTLDPVFGLLEKMINVPKSYIFGLEGELVVRPIEGLTVSTSGTYLKSKVSSHFQQTRDGFDVYNFQGYTGDFYGSVLPYTPKFSANADFQYEFPASDTLTGFVGGTLAYQGAQLATFENAIVRAEDFHIGAYTTVDARIGVKTADDRWRASLYAQNLTNEKFITAVSAFLETTIRYRGKPTVYGMSVGYRF